jgi:hypothetical protein
VIDLQNNAILEAIRSLAASGNIHFPSKRSVEKEADLVAFSPQRDLILSPVYAVIFICANLRSDSVGS